MTYMLVSVPLTRREGRRERYLRCISTRLCRMDLTLQNNWCVVTFKISILSLILSMQLVYTSTHFGVSNF